MSYRGLGYSFSAGGSVKYGDGELRTSGSAEAGAETGSKLSSQRAYAPVTQVRQVNKPPPAVVTAPEGGAKQEFPWVWVAVGAGALLFVGGAAYVATRDRKATA